MFFVIISLLAILFICDLLLVFYCKVKNGFRMFVFRVFAVLLAIMSLILTGDIQIAYGMSIDDIPNNEKQRFLTNLRSCIPYNYEIQIEYDDKVSKQYRRYNNERKYNYRSRISFGIDGLYDDDTCHLQEAISASQHYPAADAADGYGYRLPKNILSKITEDNIDKYLEKNMVFYSDVENNVNEFIPSILSKEEKEEIKKHFKADRENFYIWYGNYMDELDKKYNEVEYTTGVYIPSSLTNSEKKEIKKQFETNRKNFYSWYYKYIVDKLEKKD